MPTCPHCSSCSPRDEPAGVDACPSCGGTRVWPALDVTTDSSSSDAEVQALLQRLALRHGVLPWTLPLLVESREPLRRNYTRACWTIERRVATLRMMATARQAGQRIAALPEPDAIDIWAHEPRQVLEQTMCVCSCPPCRGTGRMMCPRCRGGRRVQCQQCHGRGQLEREDRVVTRGPDSGTQTTTIKRTEQCLGCRGSGQIDCDTCTDGRVECIQCRSSTVVEAWIEVSVERTGQVLVEADFDVEAMHAAVSSSADFETPAEQLPAALIADTGWQLPEEFMQAPERLRCMLDKRVDRIRGVRMQQLRARGTQVNIATRLQREALEFAGAPAQLVSGPVFALRQRTRLSVWAGMATLALGFGAVWHYLARSSWFVEHGRSSTLALLVGLAAVLVAALVLGATLIDLRRSLLRWAAPLAGVLLTSGLFATVWRSAEPDLLTARAAIERGELERAQRELLALAELGREQGIAEVRAEIDAARGHQADLERLQQLHDAHAPRDAAKLLREPWYDPALRDEQIKAHVARARAAIDEAWTSARADTLAGNAEALRGLDDALAADADTLAKLLDLRAAIERGELEPAQRELATLAETTLHVEARALVEAELHERLVSALHRDYALGFDNARSNEDRFAALGRFDALASLHESMIGALPSDVDRKQAATLAERLGKALDKARRKAARASR